MPTMDNIHQSGTPFDPFLFATVGKDLNDNSVTVLSTLARLGLEPWEAASDLASVTRDEARSRLGGILARFSDVPALKADHIAITDRLIELLPAAGCHRSGSAMDGGSSVNKKSIGPIIGIVLLVLFLVQTLLLGADENGN
ncbi:MAG: hypothetical protein HLUCCA12_14605 [Rhodobacteraceae bacterium HLUCCA12]|nr:MAG: hypothetical protein HLUCCA12_14605 [Rhodobacteraceae bacterium HLUCCA12]